MWILVVTLSSVKSLSTKYKWPIISLSWHKHLTFHNEILIHYRSHLSESIVFFTHRLLLDMFFTEHRICKCINQGFLILNRRKKEIRNEAYSRLNTCLHRNLMFCIFNETHRTHEQIGSCATSLLTSVVTSCKSSHYALLLGVTQLPNTSTRLELTASSWWTRGTIIRTQHTYSSILKPQVYLLPLRVFCMFCSMP